ncbi:MAG: hypothetical protein EVJ47_06350 [Candidatus Acidulodesulfobacterium ferriphilum]|uniref:Uncharacterized protein n=1 Tax=Candidatus Acidulodesulfobacterium ferriphilum TaxID=2597223 RepID=A0A519BAH5_9DELT|nr:MAG: hypothetical protein EVJ47_06350 [Candidatus Acidulodesulfobacterium ferriphilum]
MPIEIFETVSTYYKFWIPAYAGMTIPEFNFSSNRRHSCVGRNPEKKFYIGNFGSKAYCAII